MQTIVIGTAFVPEQLILIYLEAILPTPFEKHAKVCVKTMQWVK